jgi:hypothetical protein
VNRDHNLLIVSDLHLSEGFDPGTGRTSRLEDFLRDDAFVRCTSRGNRASPDGPGS